MPQDSELHKVAKDGDGHVWVAGDVVPQIKKADLVGATISISDTTQCKRVTPMQIVSKK